jgi:hypothetical protein
MTNNPVSEELRFRNEVAASWDRVFAVARFFNEQGYEVGIPGQRMRPTFEQRNSYGDDSDLWYCSPSAQVGVEVKGRNLAFTSLDTYQYPTVFVDRIQKVDASNTRV